MRPQETVLEVRGLKKEFAGRVVLTSVDLTVPREAVLSIFGRSGTGKSVLLKCLAGLMEPDAGTIHLDGRALDDASIGHAHAQRRVGYLFQGNALFDSLTAFGNVALPLEQTTSLSPSRIAERVSEALDRLGLGNFEGYFPNQMSGGMQKRLALARALVTNPELLLFDEPTAGLDPISRSAVFEMIARYRREFGFSGVIVSHDLIEALRVSDLVAVLDGGSVLFQGTPAEFEASNDPFISALRKSEAQSPPNLAVDSAHSTSRTL